MKKKITFGYIAKIVGTFGGEWPLVMCWGFESSLVEDKLRHPIYSRMRIPSLTEQPCYIFVQGPCSLNQELSCVFDMFGMH